MQVVTLDCVGLRWVMVKVWIILESDPLAFAATFWADICGCLDCAASPLGLDHNLRTRRVLIESTGELPL